MIGLPISIGSETWTGVTRNGDEYPLIYNELTEAVGVADDGRNTVYFTAPSRFLGDQSYRYVV